MEVLIVFVSMMIPISLMIATTWYFLVVEYENRNIKGIINSVEYRNLLREKRWNLMMEHYPQISKYHKYPFDGQ